MSEYKPTLYGTLKLRHERHVYTRGKNKGDAPMGRRTKTEYRILDRSMLSDSPHMAVRLHNTNVITAYQDGRIMIDCGGWADRPTTKKYTNAALPNGWYFTGHKVFSQPQLLMRTPKGSFRYYDGITFDADGAPTTELKPILARRIDKEQVAELNKDMEENGFKEMFKVLWGQAKPEDMHTNSEWRYANQDHLFSMPDLYADKWLSMVAHFAFEEKWVVDRSATPTALLNIPTPAYKKIYIKYDPATTWAYIMRWAKKDMYKTVESEVYSMP